MLRAPVRFIAGCLMEKGRDGKRICRFIEQLFNWTRKAAFSKKERSF